MKVGYKGQVKVLPGRIYAPYNPFEPKNWQTYLKEIQLQYVQWTGIYKGRVGYGLEDATAIMQKRYPGPYHVIEQYDQERGVYVLQLEFEDLREKTMWLLKWS